jgi:alkylation response protein AidB-like acyl-CoA dehydrogenase
MTNPLLNDRDVAFLLFEVLGVERLCALPAFEEHARDTFELYLDATRRVAREVLFPAYRVCDETPPRLVDGRVKLHPRMAEQYEQLLELGICSATRPVSVGGGGLPLTVSTVAHAYLAAGNLSAFGFVMLTAGAARLIESFGTDAQRETYMARMYSGEWTGTMALTEPQAGSSLADVATKAVPAADGSYRIVGSKIFISAGDHDLRENVVHLALGRIAGAPPGVKGISLFIVPQQRIENGKLVPNDVSTAGLIHKIGWRGLPSIALNFGENEDCHAYLVGEPHKGLSYMFQMMNEARIGVGMNGAATAYVAYQEALNYAKTRLQGRNVESRGAGAEQVAIIEHADVRRMLLRQKAIAEGSLHLVAYVARASDLAEHGETPEVRTHHTLLLDLLTPVAKSFPAERGFEANALAVQIHGGYGYSSEYLPEAWLRDQKLNTIHEGTSGIQGLDLIGRKLLAADGRSLAAFVDEVRQTAGRAREAGVDVALVTHVEQGLGAITDIAEHIAGLKDPSARLLHSADFLDAFGTLVVGFLWLEQASHAKHGLTAGGADSAFYAGKLCAAQYFIATEVPRIQHLVSLIRIGESSYQAVKPDWL